ncbi:MAG: HlyC/CorC family transporter [Candidatus Kerfeldbacteria bacterium]|nr:HlyC/CorC family transporter [Candidatus Kerfeldbacteria bacterium]
MNTIVLLIVLVFLSGFFSALEIAFFSLSEAKLRGLAERKDKVGRQAKLVMRIKKNPQKLLATVVVADNLVDVAASAIATAVAIEWFASLGVGIAIGIMTFVILIVGEIVPKALAQKHSVLIARWSAPATLGLVYLLSPLTFIFEMVVRAVHHLSGTPSHQAISKEEVKAMVYMGAEAGAVASEEREMIDNVFSLDTVSAEDIMTHINDVVSLNFAQSDTELIRIMTETGFSRFPAYAGNIDNIVGIMYSKDVMEALVNAAGNIEQVDIKKLVQRAIFVPEQKPVLEVLRDFQKQYKHIAIVVNEFGETRGVVTLEDVLEEVVGDIVDEQDTASGRIKRINTKTIVVDADVTVEEIEKLIDVRVYDDDHKTIAWVILDELGRVPSKGDELTLQKTKIIIEEAEEQKIKRVKLIKIR